MIKLRRWTKATFIENLEWQPEVFLHSVFLSLNKCSDLPLILGTALRQGVQQWMKPARLLCLWPLHSCEEGNSRCLEKNRKRLVEIISALINGNFEKLKQVNATDWLKENFSLSRWRRPESRHEGGGGESLWRSRKEHFYTKELKPGSLASSLR